MKHVIKKAVIKLWKFIYKIPFINKIKLRGARLECKDTFLYRCRINCKGKNNQIYVSGGTLYRCSFNILGDNNIIIIKNGLHAKNAEFWVLHNNSSIIIGENNLFTGKIYFCAEEGCMISIGNDCLFSSEVIFRTGDSHSVLDLNNNRINLSKNIEIGNHVWIGYDVKINKGVKISSNSIVGTGSIVTNKIEQENVIIAGIPAKVVKENINWCVERIQASQNKINENR